MPSVYTPTPIKLGASVTLLADGDNLDASNIHGPVETALDAIAYGAENAGQLVALNFGPKVTPTPPYYLSCAVWDEAALGGPSWWLANNGSAGRVYYSYDSGRSLSGYVSVSGVTSSAIPTHGDTDGAGNAVFGLSDNSGTSDTDKCWEGTGGTWTRRTISGLSTATGTVCAGMVYDPVNAKWLTAQVVAGAGVVKASTSANRVTWAASTLPAGVSNGYSSSGVMNTAAAAVRKDTGRILIVAHENSSGFFSGAFTDNAGTAWTAITDFASAANPTGLTLTHVTGDTWVFVASTASASKVYRSTNNGATWALVATLASSRLKRVVAVGEVLIAYANDSLSIQYPAYSTDLGATWKHGFNFFASTGTGYGVFAGGGQVLALAATDYWPSIRVGDPGKVLT